MSAVDTAAAGTVRPSTFSRVCGFGSVYAKTLRDSRLALIVVGGLVAAFLISGGAAFGQAYHTAQSRLDLANLVKSLPPAMWESSAATLRADAAFEGER